MFVRAAIARFETLTRGVCRLVIRRSMLAALILILLWPTPAQAHFGDLQSGSWWAGWNWDPVLLVTLPLLGGLYFRGRVRVLRRMGHRANLDRRSQYFLAGFLVLVVALLSPLDALSDELGSAHMLQHMLLMSVAAPLMVLASTTSALLWSLPLAERRGVGRVIQKMEEWPFGTAVVRRPIAVWLLHAAVLWVWHLPLLYETALRNRIVHDLQHVSFFAAAFLFWRVLIDPVSRRRLNRGLGVLYLFTTSLHASILGVFMTLSLRPWYIEYVATSPRWGLTALEDQQLAGLIMWMPACTIYAAAAIGLFALWIGELSQNADSEVTSKPIPMAARS